MTHHGTYRGRPVEILGRAWVTTPTGRQVELATVRFPRGGEAVIFAGDLDREKRTEGDREAFSVPRP